MQAVQVRVLLFDLLLLLCLPLLNLVEFDLIGARADSVVLEFALSEVPLSFALLLDMLLQILSLSFQLRHLARQSHALVIADREIECRARVHACLLTAALAGPARRLLRADHLAFLRAGLLIRHGLELVLFLDLSNHLLDRRFVVGRPRPQLLLSLFKKLELVLHSFL